jgi:hypothetical protein
MSAPVRSRLSEIGRARWADPEHRARVTAGMAAAAARRAIQRPSAAASGSAEWWTPARVSDLRTLAGIGMSADQIGTALRVSPAGVRQQVRRMLRSEQ